MLKVKNKNVESRPGRNSASWFGMAVELARLSRMTPRQIADDLLARGCKGRVMSAGSCPLAQRLRQILRPGKSVPCRLCVCCMDCYVLMGAPLRVSYSFDNPQSVQDFVAAVDDGLYPDLAD